MRLNLSSDTVNALLFLWATLGTGAVDLWKYLAGGYVFSITATVRGWYVWMPWLRWPVGLGFLWLAYHLSIEDKVKELVAQWLKK